MIIVESYQGMMYLAFAIIIGFSVLIWLIVRSSNEYTQAENELHADEFAGVIRDSHGPVTTWLWVAFIALTVWMIAYFIQHMGEFAQYPLP